MMVSVIYRLRALKFAEKCLDKAALAFFISNDVFCIGVPANNIC